MYALVLVGYVALGAGQAGVAGPPSQLIVRLYSSEKMCRDALKDFDRTASFRQITNGMNDYRWGFICVPSRFWRARLIPLAWEMR